jgi:hypothetical protein
MVSHLGPRSPVEPGLVDWGWWKERAGRSLSPGLQYHQSSQMSTTDWFDLVLYVQFQQLEPDKRLRILLNQL